MNDPAAPAKTPPPPQEPVPPTILLDLSLWVIAYVGHGMTRPPAVVGAFSFDKDLKLPIWRGRVYDLEVPADAAAFAQAQYEIGKSPRYRPYKVRCQPVSSILAAEEAAAERLALRAARIKADAEIAARAAEEQTAEEEALPPYEEWKLADLVEEATLREIELAEGENPRAKAPWIALLEADDIADLDETEEETEEETEADDIADLDETEEETEEETEADEDPAPPADEGGDEDPALEEVDPTQPLEPFAD